jgi:hypothetical protein
MCSVNGVGPVIGASQRRLALAVISTILPFFLQGIASAQIIDFETIPGGVPSVGLGISNQFEATHGVRFSVSDGTPLKLGDYGGDFQGWIDDNYENDVLLPQYDRGELFAVYPEAQTPGRYLVIEYVAPAAAASFEIIDIDDGPGDNPGNEEEWTIRVFNPSDSLLSTEIIRAGDPGTWDATPTLYSVDFQGAYIIARIEVEYTGGAQTPGLAFDSFGMTMPTGIPEFVDATWGRIKSLFE